MLLFFPSNSSGDNYSLLQALRTVFTNKICVILNPEFLFTLNEASLYFLLPTRDWG